MKAFLVLLALGLAQAQDPPLRQVRPEELARLIDQADKVVVKDWSEETTERDKVLFESTVRKDMDELKLALKIKVPKDFARCWCLGSVAVTFYAKGSVLVEITNQHSMRVRCTLWDSDAELVDWEPLLKWFDARKIGGPRAEYDEMRQLKNETETERQKWIAAMPPALVSVFPKADRDDPSKRDLAPLREALATQIESRTERVLALLAWYGSGAGPWSGFPAYEDVAEELLLDYTTSLFVAIANSEELTPAQLEGLARLFGSWTFSKRRPEDLYLVPPALKARLLQHVRAGGSEDPDRLARAERAFGEG